jgi:tellurite resistance protein
VYAHEAATILSLFTKSKSTIMITENKSESRRKFIALGVASAAVIAAFKFIASSSKKPATVKMLTQDGKLVEVDIAALSATKKKITNGELQNWIKK